MSFRVIALVCACLQMLATAAYAVQGDPLPGIDVSMEQNPGGIIATNTTNGTGEVTFQLPRGSFTFLARFPDPPSTARPTAAAIVLTVSAAGKPDEVIRMTASSKAGAKVGIEIRTTTPSSVRGRISEGKPESRSPEAEPSCLWASAAYSLGSVFCVAPDTAIECVKPPEWATKINQACNKAAPIVPR